MSKTWNAVKRSLKKNKEGLLVGAGVGFLIGAFWLPSNPAVLQAAQTSQGMLEGVIFDGSTVEVARNKIILSSTLFFATVGYVIDDMIGKK